MPSGADKETNKLTFESQKEVKKFLWAKFNMFAAFTWTQADRRRQIRYDLSGRGQEIQMKRGNGSGSRRLKLYNQMLGSSFTQGENIL